MNIGLVGATNVGKSTLFNRLIGQFRAIVTDIHGTTVDILHHKTELASLGQVDFFDSPGLLNFEEELEMIKHIVDQSDLLLFVIDDNVGITSKEQHIFEYIMSTQKKDATILVVNKLDKKRKTTETDVALSDYYDLGFDTIVGVSAKKERNLDELMEKMQDKGKKILLKNGKVQTDLVVAQQSSIKLAIVGKPNAGKSTLLNTLVGQDLSKVEDVAGTTRDYVMGKFTFGKQQFQLFDTAGIKRKGKMRDIEKIAYNKTLDMLKYVRPTVVFVIDATIGISHRDMSLIQEIHTLALPIVFCLNKVDLLNKKQIKAIIQKAQAHLDFAKYIPVVPLSAQKRSGIEDMIKVINGIQKENYKRIDTNKLNSAVSDDLIKRPPRFPKNKICRLYYITQIDVNAPTFVAFINHKNRANFAFKKWLENTIRSYFSFVGVPIVIRFREKKEQKEQKYKGDS